MDQYSNCADLAKTNCHTYGEKCQKVRLLHSYRCIYIFYNMYINYYVLRAAGCVRA